MRKYKRKSQTSLVSGRKSKIWLLSITKDHLYLKINYENKTGVYNNSECTVHSTVHSAVLNLIER